MLARRKKGEFPIVVFSQSNAFEAHSCPCLASDLAVLGICLAFANPPSYYADRLHLMKAAVLSYAGLIANAAAPKPAATESMYCCGMNAHKVTCSGALQVDDLVAYPFKMTASSPDMLWALRIQPRKNTEPVYCTSAKGGPKPLCRAYKQTEISTDVIIWHAHAVRNYDFGDIESTSDEVIRIIRACCSVIWSMSMEASVGSKDRHFRMTDPATTLMCGPGEDPRDMTPIVGTSLTCRDVYPVTVEGTCEEDHKLRAVWTKRSGGLCSWSPQEQPRQTAK
ncbi:uncharacterized protein L969DRAFT_88775 [Mixia osmundae IAM 14324]|uniref:uncharacterized protein n=1 Tax=Mixia osmundae (strain CBS 9802 / IAM 14324 / JCM 22182 / KY 12970) TaxID=764103 RepID=UPI0004A54CF4|nr:uncharacterized protein L969DRAFT_88775 [Mixia osmundae IAM 14324]KEI38340.1 hypothetical protein L969DRAFT_88775 [Mixia osmundae IAM 14324]